MGYWKLCWDIFTDSFSCDVGNRLISSSQLINLATGLNCVNSKATWINIKFVLFVLSLTQAIHSTVLRFPILLWHLIWVYSLTLTWHLNNTYAWVLLKHINAWVPFSRVCLKILKCCYQHFNNIVYIRPILEHNSNVWNTSQNYFIDKLENVQLRFIKIITSHEHFKWIERLGSMGL